MKIALGCDHGGYELKQFVMKTLEKLGYEYEDFGCYSTESCDYPDFGAAAARAVAEGKVSAFPSPPTRSRASAAPTVPTVWKLR